MRQTAITCDGCDEPATAGFASSKLPDDWHSVDISVEGGHSKEVDLCVELCAVCYRRLLEQADPRKWARSLVIKNIQL